jgi:exodeoxyribonuclease VII large subunit
MDQFTNQFQPEEGSATAPAVRVWPVGSLIRAIADSLQARFNPVAVKGEIAGFSRAASGHCYFNLKDEQGQVRCAMFKRAASLVDFVPRDGQLVQVRGRLGVYEPRGELQLVVESMLEAGQGNWFEQFARLKAKLELEGLFDSARKRALPLLPRSVGIITSLGAAALHDAVSTLMRRAPHVRVVIYPASVQGLQAPGELLSALQKAVHRAEVDVLLLVRGGGAMEDLWAFNDEALARAIVACPIPVISGVGHETDFTIADFCADVRAPTPTAAAELCAQPQDVWLRALELVWLRLQSALDRQLDASSQRLDRAAARVCQPSHLLARQQALLALQGQRLAHATRLLVQGQKGRIDVLSRSLPKAVALSLSQDRQRLERAQARLESMDPKWVLQRGYAWLADAQGHAITSVEQTRVGQPLRATLADGELNLTVDQRPLI